MGGIKELIPFFTGIIPEVNVIAGLEFELANYDITVQHVGHYTTETSPIQRRLLVLFVQLTSISVNFSLFLKSVFYENKLLK